VVTGDENLLQQVAEDVFMLRSTRTGCGSSSPTTAT